MPDIYYLVLDAYGRSDYLSEHYGFDNSGFIDFLRDKGFYVASQSTANYPITFVSIASTLNSTYWEEMGERLQGISDRRFMRERMQKSRVVEMLRAAGYQIVAFDSEYSEAALGDVDVTVKEWWFPNAFQLAWLQMTPLPVLLKAFGHLLLYDLHRKRVIYPIEKLPDVARRPGPKFVYFHTFFGHPPFVFGPKGERVFRASTYSWDDGDEYLKGAGNARERYLEGYRSQVTYLNSRLQAALEKVLANSEQKPIIILQGDHGPGSRFSLTSLKKTDVPERYGILNALLLPEEGRSRLYESISPVNTFRVVFNTSFGTDYPLLEDKSYYNPFLRPYDYTLVEESLKQFARQPSDLAQTQPASPDALTP